MKERVLRIGKPIPLVGVATEPSTFDPSRPAVLILNSGIMHHVGSCRMSVRLARSLAESGLLAVRFDYSGIGDSEPRRGTPSFEEVSVTECAEVMDYLQKTRGISRFVLYGLCSGADAAYNTALVDDRVVAISQFDPYCYVTFRYYLEYYLPVLTNVERWKSFLGRQWSALVRRTVPHGPEGTVDPEFVEIPTYIRVFPARESVAAGLRALLTRNVRLQVNFPAGPLYNHQSQFRSSFRDVDFKGLVEVNYYKQANHIVTQPDMQQRIIDDIVRWISNAAITV